ncbi:MAG: hypothetical protein IT260_00865 [Saprospiraceae bacterium]|nr:hypothetical protein [Saprospiraceae bacterium]
MRKLQTASCPCKLLLQTAYCKLLLLLLPAPATAQYEAILNDPDVIWAAEVTLDFVVEPEFIPIDSGVFYEQYNLSVPLKLQNANAATPDEEGVLLASKLMAWCRDPDLPAYAAPEDPLPLADTLRQARLRAVSSDNDSITVLDPVTLMAHNKAIDSYLDPRSIHLVRVRQLLYYRESSDEFEVFTAALAPVFQKQYHFCSNCGYYFAPFWFKMPPFAKQKKQKPPRLDDPGISWARRLTTRENLPALDSLPPMKDFKRPVMQQWLKRLKTDPNYAVVDDDGQPLSGPERENLLVTIDSVPTFDPETYEEVIQVVREERLAKDLMQIKLVQDWWYDDKRRQLSVRLHAFGLLVDVTDEEGNLRYKRVLCWRRKE